MNQTIKLERYWLLALSVKSLVHAYNFLERENAIFLSYSHLNRIIALEKEKSSQLYGKKSEFRKDFCELEEHEVRIAAERSKESKLSHYHRLSPKNRYFSSCV